MSSNVGYATLQIIPSAKGFGSHLDGSIGPDIRKSGAKHGREFGSIYAKSAMGPLRALGGAAAGIFAVTKIGGFLKDSVSQASDLNEAGTALKQVFGSATGSVLKFASGGAAALGQSNLALQTAATQFGIYGKAAGLAGKANAGFSTQMVGLSTDLASFYNTSPEEAATALAAGLRGESEPLRRFGVLLNDAQLRQEAMRLGIVKTTKQALTPQQRVLAAHALILKQTKVAQGDFARTSGGLANQQRILSAEFGNMKAKIGGFLLPVIVSLAKHLVGLFSHVSEGAQVFRVFFGALIGHSELNEFDGRLKTVNNAGIRLFQVFRTQVIPTVKNLLGIFRILAPPIISVAKIVAVLAVGAFLALAKTIKPVTGFLASHASATKALAVVIAALTALMIVHAAVLKVQAAGGLLAMLKATKLVTTASKAFAAVQWLVNAALDANPVGLIIIGIAALVAGIVIAYKKSETFRKIVHGAMHGVAAAVDFVRAHWKTFATVFAFLIGGPIIGAIVLLVRHFGAVKSAATSVWHWVTDKFGALVGFFRGLPGKIASATRGMFDGIKDAFRSAINWVISKWNNLSFGMDAKKVAGHTVIPGFHIGTPDIPLLAKGGIATRPTLGVFGEAGPEAIIPLSKLSSLLRGVPGFEQRAGSSGGSGALVENLTLQSTGNVHDDLEQVTFALRHIRRGGVYGPR